MEIRDEEEVTPVVAPVTKDGEWRAKLSIVAFFFFLVFFFLWQNEEGKKRLGPKKRDRRICLVQSGNYEGHNVCSVFVCLSCNIYIYIILS